jgi:nucleoside-diphosphate-sugar epimerase
LEFYYDKVLVEAAVSSRPALPATVLRLPKVYGPEDNTYNVGEASTPTVAERLRFLPYRAGPALFDKAANFEQDIVYDTSRIRRELGYSEVIEERKAMIDLLGGAS